MDTSKTSFNSQTVQENSDEVATTAIESKRHERKHIFKWTIDDFNCKGAKLGEHLPSIKLEFKLDRTMFFEGYLSICGESCVQRICRMELKNTTDKYWKVCCEIQINEGLKSSANFSHDSTLIEFLVYDSCNRRCWLKEGSNILTCEIVHVTYKQIEQPSLFEVQKSTLMTDMERLFESKTMSDVKFEVAGEVILANKLILACRSKIFADIIKQSDAKANIIVNDIEPKVFHEILRYIYTDNVLCLNTMPKELLTASQKYGLKNLKLMCEYELVRTINIDTASELLVLADENQAIHLKNIVVAFITNHCKAVADTLGWQNIMKNKLHLLADLYIKVIE